YPTLMNHEQPHFRLLAALTTRPESIRLDVQEADFAGPPFGHLPLLLRCRKGHSRLDAPLPDRLVADVNLTVPPPQLGCRPPKRSGRHCSFNRICPHRFTHPL